MATNPQGLLALAQQSRALAGSVSSPETARELERMAADYEARARAIGALRFLQGS